MPLNECVIIGSEIAAEVPVFKGTRVAVKTLFDYLEENSLEAFLFGFLRYQDNRMNWHQISYYQTLLIDEYDPFLPS